MAAITNSVDIEKVQGCVSSSVSASVFSYQCTRNQGNKSSTGSLYHSAEECLCACECVFQHSRSSGNSMWWLSDCGRALMVMLFVPEIQNSNLKFVREKGPWVAF